MLKAFFRHPDGQAGIFFTVFGAVTIYLAQDLSFGTPRQMGPGFFPVCLGVLLTVTGLWVAAQALRGVAPDDAIPRIEWRPLVMITAAVVVTAFLMIHAGLVIAIPVMTVIAAFAAGGFSLKSVVLTGLILTVMAWAIFILGLGLFIPVLEF